MKTKLLLISICLINQLSAQDVKDFFHGKDQTVYWMGIDFTHVQLVGEFSQFFGAGEKDADALATQYFPAWNELIPNEPSKYDVKNMVKKPNMQYSMDYMMGKNAAVSTDGMDVREAQAYSEDDIKKFVAEYDYENKPGYGVVFIAESMDKVRKEAYFHFVIINMQTNECLFTERIKGEPQGFGVRNYWGGSIHRTIETVASKYRGWAHKYRK